MNISNNYLAHQMQLPIPKLRILNVHETFYEPLKIAWFYGVCTSLYCMYYIIFTQHMIFFFQTKDREEEKWKSLTSMQWRIDQNSEVMPKWFELVNRWLELCPHALSCALFKKELWPTYQHLDFKTHCTIISEIVS